DDAQKEWTFAPTRFDFIHIRALLGAITHSCAFLAYPIRCIKPGGWIEQLEISIMFTSDDGTVAKDHFMAKWSQTLVDAAEKIGKSFNIFYHTKDYISDAGFVDVVEKKYRMPVGPWSSGRKMKLHGQWNRLWCDAGLESWSLFLLSKVLGWEYTEIQAYIGQMKAEIHSRKNHACY
ncbi:hypothetical protein BGZ57DRAFT_743893, partial [Hyaloscypha finlandica]